MKAYVLSKPDQFGNYFLNPDHKEGPILFRSGLEKTKGKYCILLSAEKGFLFEKDNLCYFDSAKDALDYLNQKIGD